MKIRMVLAAFLMVNCAVPLYAETSSKVILALGDSITAGSPVFRSPAEVPPEGRGNPESQYEYWLSLKYPAFQILNRGISGQTTANILARLDRELEQTRPQMVILMAGVNDIYRGYAVETAQANLAAMYQKIQTRGIPLMVLTVLPYRGLTPQKAQRLDHLNRWIRSYAAAHQLGLCDTYQALKSPENPFLLAQSNDGLHPTPQSYRAMGESIAAALELWEPFHKIAKI